MTNLFNIEILPIEDPLAEGIVVPITPADSKEEKETDGN
jgi:hypothetical protein